MLLKNWGSIYPDMSNKKIPNESVAFLFNLVAKTNLLKLFKFRLRYCLIIY